MIPVTPKPEPASFNRQVREPGRAFLAKVPRPATAEWKGQEHWRKVSKDLHTAYSGICAYSCHWIPYDTGWKTVDHFLPKAHYPAEAYEWGNFRLVCGILNGRKSSRNVLDPFTLTEPCFTLDFPSLYVKPTSSLSADRLQHARETICFLGLNDEDTCLKSRAKYVEDYCKGGISFAHLKSHAPFIAQELERQGLLTKIREIMRY